MDMQSRATGIGGSDVPAILGVSPYRDRLDVWLEKTGHPSWRPKAQTPEMRFGTLLEPIMRAAYSEDTGWTVHAPGDRTYAANDGIRFAHIDGIVVPEGIWEGKAPFQTWRNWGEGPPAYVHAQVQHYLDLTGEPWCDVSALAAGLDPIFQTWRVKADPAVQDNIRTAVLDFWHNEVLAEVPPGGGLPAVVEFPVSKRDLYVVAEEEDEALVRSLFLTKHGVAEEQETEEELKEQLRRKIGTAAGMVGDGWRIRYKSNKDSVVTDWKLVAQSYRKMLEMVDTDSGVEMLRSLLTDSPLDTILSLYTSSKPGARPFILEEVKD